MHQESMILQCIFCLALSTFITSLELPDAVTRMHFDGNYGSCRVSVIEQSPGSLVHFRCSVNVLAGDYCVLLLDGEIAAVDNTGAKMFPVSMDVHKSNVTVVVVDNESGEIIASGQLLPEQASEPRNADECNLNAAPDFPMSVVVVPSKPKFYYVHFVGRNASGDMGEDAADWTGLCPSEIVNFFSTMIRRAINGVIVDIGANKGSHSCYPAALGATVWAVEPYEIHARRLQYMAALNRWKLHVFCGGADVFSGSKEIHDTGSNFEMRNVLLEPGKYIQSSRKVPVTRIDDWVKESNKITLMKIDTDGNDFYALQGAVGLFKHPGVKYMKIEFIPYSLETAHNEKGVALKMLKFIREQGFSIFYLPLDSHYLVMEWFCHELLLELPPSDDEYLVSALVAKQTVDFPWAMTTLLAVNAADINDLPLDFPCLI